MADEMLYTVGEVAKILKTNVNYVYELRKAGLLRFMKLGTLKCRRSTLEAFLEKEIEVIDVKGRTPAAEGVQQRKGRPEGAGGQPGKDSLPKGPGGQKGGKASGQPRQQRYRNMAGELLEWDLSGGALDEEEDIEEQEAGEGDGFVGPEDLRPDEWDAEEEDSEDWENKGLSRYYGFEGVAVKKK